MDPAPIILGILAINLAVFLAGCALAAYRTWRDTRRPADVRPPVRPVGRPSHQAPDRAITRWTLLHCGSTMTRWSCWSPACSWSRREPGRPPWHRPGHVSRSRSGADGAAARRRGELTPAPRGSARDAGPHILAWPRILAAAWVVVGVILIRMASGGGTLVGLEYVLNEAPLPAVLAGGTLLLAAIVLVAAFARDAAWAWRASAGVAVVAIAFCVVVGLRGHESAWLLGGAAIVALWIGWRSDRTPTGRT